MIVIIGLLVPGAAAGVASAGSGSSPVLWPTVLIGLQLSPA